MRDLYLTCPVVRGAGGIQTYARTLLESLAPETITVLSQGKAKEVAELPANARYLGSPASRSRYAARLAYDYLTRPPSVFLFVHVGLTSPLALLPRRHDHRVVMIGHGIEIWPKLGRRRAAGLSHVDSFVFTARYNRALFLARNQQFVPAAASTVVIPLSASREVEAKAPFAAPTGPRRRVVCITRLVAQESLKGLPSLIAAAQHLPPEWDVVIVGDGAARPSLEKQAAALGVTHRIRFAGWLNNEARTKELAEADVFCLPSAQEGFGIVFLEAMAAGRPCVGAAAGAIPEVLPTTAGETFPFDDEVALAAAIVRTGDRFRSGALTPEGIRGVYESRYAWSRFRDSWANYLNDLRA